MNGPLLVIDIISWPQKPYHTENNETKTISHLHLKIETKALDGKLLPRQEICLKFKGIFSYRR